jgi:pilin isopeptide linkage protein
VGTKTYTVRERNNGLGGVTYAVNTYTVTVDIKDNGDGTLDVDPSSNYNALNFTNTYAATGSLTLSGQKTLNGRALVPGEFTFEVYPGDSATGTPIRTTTNGTGGVISLQRSRTRWRM